MEESAFPGRSSGTFFCATLVEILRWRAATQGEQRAYTFLVDGGSDQVFLTYAQLDQQARRIAALLQQHTGIGARALLLYPPGLEYIAAFMGCLYAGVIAVPAYPPSSQRSFARIHAIARDAQTELVLSTQQIMAKGERWLTQLPELGQLKWLAADRNSLTDTYPYHLFDPDIHALTFLQYTSGSTGTPKGVMVSHANLMHNSEMMCERWGHNEQSVGVSWLPMFHDMGLIAGVLQPLYVGFPAILMPPVAFMQHPLRWLQAISTYGGTTSCAPNFAFELCTQRVTSEELQELDLSTWLIALNGAEPIRAETMQRFLKKFAPCGLRPATLTPGYGLAEGTLMVSSAARDAQPTFFPIDKRCLEQQQVRPALPDDSNALTLVGCGSPSADQTIVIVHPETGQRCRSDEIGEIWVAGPSITGGYWQHPTESSETFQAMLAETGQGPFLRTGDLGFVSHDELFVTGRLKDLIIVRGRNYYPQDVELAAEQSHPALRAGCGAAFSCETHHGERVVLVQEIRRDYSATPDISRAMRQAVAELFEIQIATIVLVRQGSILKTSSGKIQRRACKAAFLNGELQIVGQDALGEETVDLVGQLPTREELLSAQTEQRQALLLDYVRRRLAEIVHAPLADIAPETNFYALGLDSLTVAELKQHIDTHLQTNIPYITIVEEPTSIQLVRLLQAELAGETGSSLSFPPIVSSNEPRPDYPLSFLQEQLWFLQQLQPESGAAYTIPVVLHIQGELAIQPLIQSMQAIIERHEGLRTTFVERDGLPVQSIHPQGNLSFPLISLEACPGAFEREELARSLLRQAARQTFDLSRQIPIRVVLVRLGAEEHMLLLAIHHIAADGWSVRILLNELSLLYDGFCAQKEPHLPELPIRYRDYALQQRHWATGEARAFHLAYWRTQLQGVVALELPADHPRPAIHSYRGAVQRFRCSSRLLQKLKELGRLENVTPFTILLAIFQVLLFRSSGQKEFAIGTDIADRYRLETKELVGLFVNTCVLRCDLSSSPTFRTFLHQVHATCLAAYAHQDLPFPIVVEALRPQRHLSHNPLFQILFTFQQALPTSTPKTALQFQQQTLDLSVAQFDVSMDLSEHEDGLEGIIAYSTDLFEASTIDHLVQSFQVLLENCIAHPDISVAHMPVFTPERRSQLLREQNATERPYPLHTPFHQHFAERVRQAPSAIAVVCGEEHVTYALLDRCANQLGRYLQEAGVGPETLVGLFMERSVDILIAVLALFKVGGAYLPLDPAYPTRRLVTMLEDAQVQIVITQTSLQTSLPVATCIHLDTSWSVLEAYSQEALEIWSCQDQIAYVIYTSGSTGHPKGVMINQRGMLNHLFAKIETLQLSADDRVAQNASASFDVSVWQMLAVLLCGGQTHILPDRISHDPEELFAWIARTNITILEVVPALLRAFCANAERSRGYPTLNLRWLLVTGEAFPTELCLLWNYAYSHIPLVNAYGPTECSDDVTHAVIYHVPDQTRAGVPIGHPVANTQIYILDAYGEPVPPGVPGEIHVGGTGVGRGYLGQAERTAATFIPDPFGKLAGARLYRTGDLGKYLFDGQIEFLGRRDLQVKLHGYRIEMGEIEAVLKFYPTVRDCAVLAWNTATQHQQLVAYICSEAGTAPTSAELREHLRQHLPEYMHPSSFLVFDALPLTTNGKLDRQALPAPQVHLAEEPFLAPRSLLEQQLTAIWKELLDLPQVSIDANFFELGGHSLLATQLISRLRTRLHLELPLRSVFISPTIAALAREIATLHNDVVIERSPLLPVTRKQPLPLSFAQQRLWFLQKIVPENAAYIIPIVFQLQGHLRPDILYRCLERLIERHEILRTSFQFEQGQAVQVIATSMALALPIIDLQGLDAQTREVETTRLLREDGARPFSLERLPLMRFSLLRLQPEEHLLPGSIHHIIFDGWSQNIFLRELASYYAALSTKSMVPPEHLPIQYADFAAWQRDWLQGDVLEKLVRYWHKQLSGAPLLQLPTDKPRPAVTSYKGESFFFELTSHVSQQLALTAQRAGVTLFMLLLAALQTFFYRYTGQEDIVLGTDIANRTLAETEDLIGFFVNILAMRTRFAGNPRFQEIVQQVREMVLAAYMHQDLPFDKLIEAIQVERKVNQLPLINVLFVFENLPFVPPQNSEVRFRARTTGVNSAKFDLALFLWEEGNCLRGGINYSSDLFEPSTIQRIVACFQRLLQSVSENISIEVDKIDISTEAEYERLQQEEALQREKQRQKLKRATRQGMSLSEHI